MKQTNFLQPNNNNLNTFENINAALQSEITKLSEDSKSSLQLESN